MKRIVAVLLVFAAVAHADGLPTVEADTEIWVPIKGDGSWDNEYDADLGPPELTAGPNIVTRDGQPVFEHTLATVRLSDLPVVTTEIPEDQVAPAAVFYVRVTNEARPIDGAPARMLAVARRYGPALTAANRTAMDDMLMWRARHDIAFGTTRAQHRFAADAIMAAAVAE